MVVMLNAVQVFSTTSLHCSDRGQLLPKLSDCSICIKHRVTTCLENLEMSGNLIHVRDVTNSQGKNLVMEKYPKTVHY